MPIDYNDTSRADTLVPGQGASPYLVGNHLHLRVGGDMDFDPPEVPNFRIRLNLGARPCRAQ